jgi:hypothetical protein
VIVLTWVFYAVGALYIVGPVLAWVLFAWSLWRLYTRPGLAGARLSPGVLLWSVGMLVMLVALLMGHANWDLGMGQTIKSSIGWAKGWALMALFVVAGAVLDIRPRILARAVCILGAQTLVLLPVMMLAWLAGLPERLFVSPLSVIGGPGPEFFAVQLYLVDPGSGTPRWQFFSPWAPAAGFVALIHALIAWQEPNRIWRALGLAAAVVICLLTASRLALVAMVVVPVAVWGLGRLTRPSTWFLGAAGSVGLGLAASWLVVFAEDMVNRFRSARADSSRVREALGRIAIDRWQTEAPVWGHGIVERGPHLVEYMPIGSHHSWYGLLFVKGAVGFGALALPMAWSVVELTIKAQRSGVARLGLGIVLVMFLYTFGENLEILTYLLWPGLVVLGGAFARPWPWRTEAAAANSA